MFQLWGVNAGQMPLIVAEPRLRPVPRRPIYGRGFRPLELLVQRSGPGPPGVLPEGAGARDGRAGAGVSRAGSAFRALSHHEATRRDKRRDGTWVRARRKGRRPRNYLTCMAWHSIIRADAQPACRATHLHPYRKSDMHFSLSSGPSDGYDHQASRACRGHDADARLRCLRRGRRRSRRLRG